MVLQPSPAEVYEDFLVRYQFRPFTEDLVARAAPRPGERVLDLACGTGIVARLVAPRVAPVGTVVGLDVNPAMLAIARGRAAAEGAAVTWDEGSATTLPYGDGAFDLALCQQGLQFFPDQSAALSELHRTLAPGGRLLTSTWAPLDQSPAFAAYNRVAQAHLGLAPCGPSFSLTDAERVRGLLMGVGFGSVEVAPVELTVTFPSLGEFVRRFVQSVAAVVPALAERGPEALAETARGIEEELRPQVRQYLDGGAFSSPLRTHVAAARR
jgi:SAM-dependent methyltransferase